MNPIVQLKWLIITVYTEKKSESCDKRFAEYKYYKTQTARKRYGKRYIMQLQSKDKWSNYSKIKVIFKVSKPSTDKEVFHNKLT